jgi:hypothetical protein
MDQSLSSPGSTLSSPGSEMANPEFWNQFDLTPQVGETGFLEPFQKSKVQRMQKRAKFYQHPPGSSPRSKSEGRGRGQVGEEGEAGERKLC